MEAIPKKVHKNIIDWYERNDEYVIKPKVIWNTPKEQVANRREKLFEEAIKYAVNGPKVIEDQSLVYFDNWMNNKAQNAIFNLQQLFPHHQSGGVAYVAGTPCQRVFKNNNLNNSFQHKLEKWSRASCPSQILWIPVTAKGGHHVSPKISKDHRYECNSDPTQMPFVHS